jgi:hypothetical protein
MDAIGVSLNPPHSWADHARDILKQARSDFEFWPAQLGAWYVTFDRGSFIMRPFGSGAEWRYSFWCRIDLDFKCWIFEVMP